MSLTWKKQTLTLEHRGPAEHILVSSDSMAKLAYGAVDIVSLETLEPRDKVDLPGAVNFRRGAQLAIDNHRVATLDDGQISIRVVESIGDLPRIVAIDGARTVVESAETLHVLAPGASPVCISSPGSFRAGVQADMSGRHVVVANHEGIAAYVVTDRSEVAQVETPADFELHYDISVAVREDVLFVFAPGDVTSGQGIDPTEGATGGTQGAILVFAFQDGTWRFRHRIKGTVDQDRPYGRFFHAGPGLLAVPREDKKLDVFEVSPAGDVVLSKVFAKGHYWHGAGFGANVIVVANGRPSSFDVWRGRPKARKGKKSDKPKPGATKAATIPDVVRRLPERGSLGGAIAHLEKLATQCTTRRAFAQLCDKAAEAWERNARELEAALPQLDAALGDLGADSRSISAVFRYPDAPGWIQLARSAHFDSDYGDPKGEYAEMGRCPLPPHLRRLTIEHNRLRGNHVQAMLSGPYLSELEVLQLLGRIGDKGAKAIAKAELPRLRLLALYNNEIGLGGVQAILASRGLPELRALDLRFNNRTAKLRGAFATAAPFGLTELRVQGCSLTDEDVVDIAQHGPELECLELRANRLGADTYETLASIASLREVHIDLATPPPRGFAARMRTLEVGAQDLGWSEADLADLVSDATGLERLVLRGRLESLGPLREASALRELVLDRVPEEVSLDPLTDLPSLRVLGIDHAESVVSRFPEALAHLERPGPASPPTQAPWVPLGPSSWGNWVQRR